MIRFLFGFVLIVSFASCDKESKGKSHFAGAWQCDKYTRTSKVADQTGDTIVLNCGELYLRFEGNEYPNIDYLLTITPEVIRYWNLDYLRWDTEQDGDKFIYLFIDDPYNPASLSQRTRVTVSRLTSSKMNWRFYYADADQNLLFTEEMEFSKP